MIAPRRAGLAGLALAGCAALATAGGSQAAPVVRGVHLDGRTALQKVVSRDVFVDTGTVTGSPVGSGRIVLRYALDPSRGTAVTTFTIANRHGTVRGRCLSSYSVTRLHITFTGAAGITGGTGRYAGITGSPLEFNAVHSATGRREIIAFTGRSVTPR